MQPWEAYQLYTAVKLHFTSDSYDAVKYNFKSSATQKSFLQRKDRFHFAKLAKKYPTREQLIDFLVANAVHLDPGCWVGQLLDRPAENCYASWAKMRDSFSYWFTGQIDRLVEKCVADKISFEQLFRQPKAGAYPEIIRYYGNTSDDTIALETIVVFDLLLDFMKHQKVTETIFWPKFSLLVHKYRLFLCRSVDLKKCKVIALKRFTDAGC